MKLKIVIPKGYRRLGVGEKKDGALYPLADSQMRCWLKTSNVGRIQSGAQFYIRRKSKKRIKPRSQAR